MSKSCREEYWIMWEKYFKKINLSLIIVTLIQLKTYKILNKFRVEKVYNKSITDIIMNIVFTTIKMNVVYKIVTLALTIKTNLTI